MPARLLHHDNAPTFRKRTKHVDLDPSELGDELNIVPFLDIVVNLIMFLLLMVTSAVAFLAGRSVSSRTSFGRHRQASQRRTRTQLERDDHE
ncbi:MAG: hypothetical protein R3A47_01285 [Polyangiales bacterium]